MSAWLGVSLCYSVCITITAQLFYCCCCWLVSLTAALKCSNLQQKYFIATFMQLCLATMEQKSVAMSQENRNVFEKTRFQNGFNLASKLASWNWTLKLFRSPHSQSTDSEVIVWTLFHDLYFKACSKLLSVASIAVMISLKYHWVLFSRYYQNVCCYLIKFCLENRSALVELNLKVCNKWAATLWMTWVVMIKAKMKELY